MNNSAPFEQFSVLMQKRGCHEFILDFSSCDGLDSTFLGILLGMSVGLDDQRSRVVIVNAREGVLRLLGEVGIDRLLEICPENISLPEIPMQRLKTVDSDRETRASMILRAHENLCQVHHQNRERFGGFIELLREELANVRTSKQEKDDTGSPHD